MDTEIWTKIIEEDRKHIKETGCSYFDEARKESDMATMAWKVFGAEGHRQKESFNSSYKYDFTSERDGVRIIEVENSDITGTNEYTIIRVTRDTEDNCWKELSGQLSDGIFENCRTGRIETI